MNIKHGRAAWTCSKNIQHGNEGIVMHENEGIVMHGNEGIVVHGKTA
jgi:hypothetical protein